MTRTIYHISAFTNVNDLANLFRGLQGIYVWTCLSTGKQYVGSTSDLNRRVIEYLNRERLERELTRGQSIIYRAMLKYGFNDFTFQVLEIHHPNASLSNTENAKLLRAIETRFIKSLNPAYNILPVGGTSAGYKLSDDTRARISTAKTPELRARVSNMLKGRITSESTRALISISASKSVSVLNSDRVLLVTYKSIGDCSVGTGVGRSTIGRAIKSGACRNGYYFVSADVITANELINLFNDSEKAWPQSNHRLWML